MHSHLAQQAQIGPTTRSSSTSPRGVGFTAAVFGAGSILLLVCTNLLIPSLSEHTGIEPILCWFVLGGLGVFLPLLLIALWLLRQEGWPLHRQLWSERLRFRPMNGGDWVWAVGTIVVIGALSTLLMQGLSVVVGDVKHGPEFMAFKPLTPDRYWLLAAWLPFWALNIMGEEILWRGVMLPSQEKALGRFAWLVHAAGWTLFHIAFGWQLLVILLPVLFLLPYVVQRRQNSWIGVVIHAGINGPGFIAVAFGLQ